jgi:hypothetical protein
VKLLKGSERTCKLSLNIVGGTGPLSEFQLRNKALRDDKAPSSSGSVPVKLFLTRE